MDRRVDGPDLLGRYWAMKNRGKNWMEKPHQSFVFSHF